MPRAVCSRGAAVRYLRKSVNQGTTEAELLAEKEAEIQRLAQGIRERDKRLAVLEAAAEERLAALLESERVSQERLRALQETEAAFRSYQQSRGPRDRLVRFMANLFDGVAGAFRRN